jgi:AraC-like DNA-binding protein
LGLCTFPVLVLYTWHATEAEVSVRNAWWWWMPAVAYAGLIAVRTAAGFDSRVPFVWMLPVVLGFTAVSVTILSRRAARRTAVVPAEWIVGYVLVINAAQIVRMEFGHVPVIRAVVPLAIAAGFLAIAAYAASRTVAAAASPTTRAGEAPRYGRSGLENALAADLRGRIDLALTRDRLFARSDLTLAHLAAAVHATPHHVSEVLNRYAGVSFHDLINRRRVEDVKAQLRDPASDAFTIEGIGASAGFGSRSALYAAFRRFEGTTPTAFRRAGPHPGAGPTGQRSDASLRPSGHGDLPGDRRDSV